MCRILKYIFVLLLLCDCFLLPATGRIKTERFSDFVPEDNDSTIHMTHTTSKVRGIQYDASADSLFQLQKDLPIIAGFSVSGDLAGAVIAITSSYGQYEGSFRINMKGKYFPIVEIGYGTCDYTDESTNIHCKASSPFFRIGCDYNFARNVRDGGRILGGLRYGFTSFNYNIDGPDMIDPIWGMHVPFSFNRLSGQTHWAEVVFGVEAKIWKIFRLGWNVRYRLRIKDKASAIGHPWYVPGFGKNDTHALSGTFNLIFDI